MTIAKNLLPVFATPVVNTCFDDVNALNNELQTLILSENAKTPGVVKSNVGGWHSALDFFERGERVIDELYHRLHTLASEFAREITHNHAHAQLQTLHLQGWANVLRFGDYNSLHSHPNSFWSGVYFVNGNTEVDGHPMSGRLELIDPRPGASLVYSEITKLYGRFLINPVPGQVVLFPPWLQHQVHPYFATQPRISIAFNLLL